MGHKFPFGYLGVQVVEMPGDTGYPTGVAYRDDGIRNLVGVEA